MPKQSAKSQALDWNDCRCVLAVFRAGALASAARRLGVDATTVSRRLARLEQALGARLFDRIGGRLIPTDAGRLAAAHAERMEAEADGLRGAVAGRDAAAAGAVRFTTVPVFANRVLIPALPALFARHPGLTVELVAESRDLSLTKRDADLALRLARPRGEQSVVARRLGRVDYAVYGKSGRSASALPWIAFDDAMSGLPTASWLLAAIRRDGRAAGLRVNDADSLLPAIRGGLGKSLLPRVVGEREAGLRRLSGAEPVLARELWLLVHPELKSLARIRAVIAWVEETLAAAGIK